MTTNTYVLDFKRAAETITTYSCTFIREPGAIRDILDPNTAFAKTAESVGLPGGILRWLLGVPDLEETYAYPVPTAETALWEVHKSWQKATQKPQYV
jgi:hypothetical protein